jgi:hypothetical protein
MTTMNKGTKIENRKVTFPAIVSVIAMLATCRFSELRNLVKTLGTLGENFKIDFIPIELDGTKIKTRNGKPLENNQIPLLDVLDHKLPFAYVYIEVKDTIRCHLVTPGIEQPKFLCTLNITESTIYTIGEVKPEEISVIQDARKLVGGIQVRNVVPLLHDRRTVEITYHSDGHKHVYQQRTGKLMERIGCGSILVNATIAPINDVDHFKVDPFTRRITFVKQSEIKRANGNSNMKR